jgi:hypothetical protein
LTADRGIPPLAASNQIRVTERLKEVHAAGGTQETLTIEWRGQPLHVEVIDMPVKDLFYNPNTHRIRAQRSHDPVLDEAIDKDPWSPQSQDYLHYLLQALPRDPSVRDPDFDVLIESLREFKQTDPGLISREGILVNGNTRRAALKELGVAEMRVGVLPASTTWDDISAVELSLQLRKDHRREYSYINRLLAIDEQVKAGRPLSEIAREFHIRLKTCEQDVWILSCLNDLIGRSRTGDQKLRLMHFEEAQEKLRELHRRYEKEAAGNKESANILREMRLAAVALEFSKTDIRVIEPEFRNRYLDNYLPPTLKTAPAPGPGEISVPGINLTIPNSGAKLTAAKALTDTILKARAVSLAGSQVTPAESLESAHTYNEARAAFKGAIDSADRERRQSKRSHAASARIADACVELEQCVTDLAVARGSNSLDEEAYDESIQRLRVTLRKLAEASARSIRAPGDGVTWLLEISAEDSL